MAHRVCPWWVGYLLASPLRRLLQDPRAILKPYVADGMTVLEPGPGMGFFTLELARLVGPTGRVIAIDVQPNMLAGLLRRARKSNLAGRIEARQPKGDHLGIDDCRGAVDFALAFAMVHEVPRAETLLGDLHDALKPGAKLLLAEPLGHVSVDEFERTLAAGRNTGFELESRPAIRRSRAAVLLRA
ncbi:MAG: methyltransferase domain-containing protein [Limisphaerales bacterium]